MEELDLTLHLTRRQALEAATDWAQTAREIRWRDWDFFLAEFDQFAAADEAARLYAWKHHLTDAVGDDETYDLLVAMLDAWYGFASERIGRFAPRYAGNLS